MKKSLFFVAAASALMLTACSSESDVLQSATPTQTTVEQQAVGFDMYTPASTNSRRAGYAGVMTTEKLKTNTPAAVGFGVFAFYHDNNVYAAGLSPNFMYNEHVTWAGGWTYSPLKYWPNETAKNAASSDYNADSQSTPATAAQLDKISFFAYAPYVSTGAGATLSVGGGDGYYHSSPEQESGILAIYREDFTGDRLVKWGVSNNPDNNVDLLWGVAPEGLSYTAVNGTTINTTAGMPILNMVKPDKDQKIKFLFEHALSRIGLTVVSAIDQVADGGNLDANTKVLIDEVIIYGDFGTQGVLNLNNTVAHQANWTGVTRTASTEGSPLFRINGTNHYLAPSLRYVTSQITAVGTSVDNFASVNAGVQTYEQPLMVGGPDPSKKVTSPSYKFGTVLYKESSGDYVVATTNQAENVDAYTKSGDNYTQARKAGGADLVMDGTIKYFKLALTNPISVSSAGTGLTADAWYYVKGGSDGNWTYTKVQATGSYPTGVYYTLSDVTETELQGANYTAGDYYTALSPRYFMVIPSDVTPIPTNINVKITYHVVTKDAKLTSNVSDVTNAITKTVPVTLVNGKSYNLKLILGLTSVKLDATVKDWELADETEINLPQNN